jgi:hypothetical protein
MSRSKFYFLTICFFLFSISGCATHKMALTLNQTSLDTSKKSIGLLSLKISNQNKPDYKIPLYGIHIVPKPLAQTGFGDVNGGNLYNNVYKTEDVYRTEKDNYYEYLLSFELSNGANTFIDIWAFYNSFFLAASSFIPLNMEVDIKPNSVTYLGHLDVVLRPKMSGEKRAGTLPLIDAAVVGFTSGTFDVKVEDRFDEDIKSFSTAYPALQNIQVDKSILPQWVRPQ